MNAFLNAGHQKLRATIALLLVACQHDEHEPEIEQSRTTTQEAAPLIAAPNVEHSAAPAVMPRPPITQPLKADVSGLTLVDSLDVGDTKSEVDHLYAIDQPTFAGTNDYDFPAIGTSFRETLRATRSFETFRLKVSPGKEHLLVKGVDTLSRNQKVRVLVDGKPMSTEWSMPNGPERYEEASLIIPASMIGDHEQITLRFEFRDASIDLNSLTYWLYVNSASTAALR
jgi:hypothetical protein